MPPEDWQNGSAVSEKWYVCVCVSYRYYYIFSFHSFTQPHTRISSIHTINLYIFHLPSVSYQVHGLCMGVSEGRWDIEQINRLDSLWRLLVRPVFWSCFVKGLLGICFWRTVYDTISIYCPEWEQNIYQQLRMTTPTYGVGSKYTYDCTIDHLLAVLVLTNCISWLVYPPLTALGRRAYNAIRDENYLIGRRLQVS